MLQIIEGPLYPSLLKIHLQTLSVSIKHEDSAGGSQELTFKELKLFTATLTKSQKSFLPEVVKIISLAPSTNAASERSCSAL